MIPYCLINGDTRVIGDYEIVGDLEVFGDVVANTVYADAFQVSGSLAASHISASDSLSVPTVKFGEALQQSDIRQKSNVLTIDKGQARDDTRRLEPIEYDLPSRPGRKHHGLGAQQIRDIWPDAVVKDKVTGDLLVDYTAVLTKFIAAWQSDDAVLQSVNDRVAANSLAVSSLAAANEDILRRLALLEGSQ